MWQRAQINFRYSSWLDIVDKSSCCGLWKYAVIIRLKCELFSADQEEKIQFYNLPPSPPRVDNYTWTIARFVLKPCELPRPYSFASRNQFLCAFIFYFTQICTFRQRKRINTHFLIHCFDSTTSTTQWVVARETQMSKRRTRWRARAITAGQTCAKHDKPDDFNDLVCHARSPNRFPSYDDLLLIGKMVFACDCRHFPMATTIWWSSSTFTGRSSFFRRLPPHLHHLPACL